MSLESDLFKRRQAIPQKLIDYGFTYKEGTYRYSTVILEGDFKVEISISDQVEGKVIDLFTDEEYVLVHTPNSGEFVNRVRQEYLKVLEEIARECFVTTPFIFAQSNRIAAWIEQTYHVRPAYLWEKFPGNGVFRNSGNQKWFGIIMPIDQKKLNGITKETEVLNVKVNADEIPVLLEMEGVYPAYHMNKKSWISIQMNDLISDDQIKTWVKDSYAMVQSPVGKGKEWLIPSNPKYYDIVGAFKENAVQTWKQTAHIHVNDVVYMYVGVPYSAILFKCLVIESDIPYEYKSDTISMKKMMRLQLLETYEKTVCPLSKMKSFGVKGVRGQRYMPRSLSQYLEDETQNGE